jgi:multicomponent Na+:H+ antiporter subunit D
VPGSEQLAPLAIAVPIVAGCLLLGVGRIVPRPVVDAVACAGALVVTGLDVALLVAAGHGRVVGWVGGWTPVDGFSVGIALVADPLAVGAATLAARWWWPRWCSAGGTSRAPMRTSTPSCCCSWPG